ncbi:MAG: PadR family transcriptional regulator [Gammaproteobacteria bacterium]|nr:PadR family transcriptional regulator [Gammaproteobacteria bacterium]
MGTKIRITGPGLRVLQQFSKRPTDNIAGAELMRECRVSSGTLYPLLHRFERAGLLDSNWENVDPATVKRPRKRFYRITALGVNTYNEIAGDFGLPLAVTT